MTDDSVTQSKRHHGLRTTKCSQCGTVIIGGTPEDWWIHYEEDCNVVGTLYSHANEPTESKNNE